MNVKVIRSNRKSMSLSIDDELNPVVRAPFCVKKSEIDSFVLSNSGWIEKAVMRKKAQLEKTDLSDAEISRLVNLAKEIIPKRVEYYSDIMNLKPTGVKITKAKKRFGSCNGKNSLCFSCFLMSYPMEAVDYVVVHELAHIKHHNHGREFYDLIRSYMPDYKEREKILKKA